MTWRYVAARENQASEDVWTIRELYDDNGKLSWSTGAMAPQGETWLEMFDDLSRMGADAAGVRFLDLTLDPPQLVERTLRTKKR